MSEGKILALDLATKTGWATNAPEYSGVENFRNSTRDSRGMIYVRFGKWFNEMLESYTPSLIVYEQLHLRGAAATELLTGLLGQMERCIEEYCYNRNTKIEHASIHSGTIKKFATGKGNASKEQMMKSYYDRFGKDPEDDNECDARFLLELSKEKFI
jgi:Holliday junction resolvasome RuvABC endonuclease subunit